MAFVRRMITLTQIAYLACLWPIWREFGWEVFKTIGADRRVKKSYAWFQVFICVLKFGASPARSPRLDLVLVDPRSEADSDRSSPQISSSSSPSRCSSSSSSRPRPTPRCARLPLSRTCDLQLRVLTLARPQRWITVAALPVTSGMLLLGYLAVKHENRTGYWCFLASCALGSAYFIYKVRRSRSLSTALSARSSCSILTLRCALSPAAVHHLPRPRDRLPPRLQVAHRLRCVALFPVPSSSPTDALTRARRARLQPPCASPR